MLSDRFDQWGQRLPLTYAVMFVETCTTTNHRRATLPSITDWTQTGTKYLEQLSPHELQDVMIDLISLDDGSDLDPDSFWDVSTVIHALVLGDDVWPKASIMSSDEASDYCAKVVRAVTDPNMVDGRLLADLASRAKRIEALKRSFLGANKATSVERKDVEIAEKFFESTYSNSSRKFIQVEHVQTTRR